MTSRDLTAPLGVALLLKAVLVALLLAAAARWPADLSHVGPREAGAPEAVWQLARGWDSHAYQRLAANGYENAFSRAFPPGYPWLIAAAAPLCGGTQTAALVVANLGALIALLLFAALARRYAARLGRGDVPLAILIFASMPGVLAYGSVAYSEGPFLALLLGAWLAYLAAEGPAASPTTDPTAPRPAPVAHAPRSLPLLALASLLGLAATFVRNAAVVLFLAWGACEFRRVIVADAARRGRALGEAAALLWGGLALLPWFAWQYGTHDLAGAQRDVFGMEFSFLGGLPSLLRLGTAPEYIVQILFSLPLVALLIGRLLRVDARLALLALLLAVLSLSYTGIAAQSAGRYLWSIGPLALGALLITDRALGYALAAFLFLLSLQAGIGHVLGTSML